jgi:hypothetical protein
MNRTSRLFLMGSGFVLAAGLGTGLVAYYGGLPTLASPSGSAGLDELKYVPEAAAVVAYADVHDVMASEFRQKLRQVLPDHDTKGQEEFQKETGINIEQDIDFVLAWLAPQPPSAAQATEAPDQHRNPLHNAVGLVLLKGRFDQGRLEALALSHGGLVETIDGVRVLRPDPARRDAHKVEAEKLDDDGDVAVKRHHHMRDKAPVVAFLEPGLIAFGEEPVVRAAIGHRAGGRSIRDNQEMSNLIADLEGSSNVWAVGRMEALADRASLPEPIATHLPAVKWFSASSHVGSGVSGLLRVEARDDEAAKNLRDVLQGFLAMARLHAGSKPELAPAIQSLQVSGTGTTVALSFEIPPQLVDTLIELKNAN